MQMQIALYRVAEATDAGVTWAFVRIARDRYDASRACLEHGWGIFETPNAPLRMFVPRTQAAE